MKKSALFVLLLLATLAPAAPAPQEYSINVHVTSSFVVAGSGLGPQMLDVIIEGKKYELSSPYNGYLLGLGDYTAKLIKDEHKSTYESLQTYEFLFPDKKTRKFQVVGQSE
jgi:hypothetical protein